MLGKVWLFLMMMFATRRAGAFTSRISKTKQLMNFARFVSMSTIQSPDSPSSIGKAQYIFASIDGIKKCADHLASGGLVAFPTETVYGLGGNALDADVVKSIFASKQRPASDPVIVHVSGKDQIYSLFDFSESKLDLENKNSGTGNGKDTLEQKLELELDDHPAHHCISALIDSFWPGPLTIIYKAAAGVFMFRAMASTLYCCCHIPYLIVH